RLRNLSIIAKPATAAAARHIAEVGSPQVVVRHINRRTEAIVVRQSVVSSLVLLPDSVVARINHAIAVEVGRNTSGPDSENTGAGEVLVHDMRGTAARCAVGTIRLLRSTQEEFPNPFVDARAKKGKTRICNTQKATAEQFHRGVIVDRVGHSAQNR